MTLEEGSIIGSGSEINIATQSGEVDISGQKGMTLADINVLTQEDAEIAIAIAEAALADLDATRSGLGSVQNQLTSTISNLSVTKTNVTASESTIRDVDFAAETANFAKLSLLAQTGSYALSQANAASSNLTSLLQ
jgi:flagellin